MAPDQNKSTANSGAALTVLSWCVIVLTNAILLYLIAHSPDHSIYDETDRMATLDLLRQYGLFTRRFMLELPGSPGPTFTIIYTGLQNILHLNYPWLRLVNFAFLLGTAFLLWLLLQIFESLSVEKLFSIDSALFAAAFTVLPAIGVSGGMTLSEMPAIFLMLCFLVGLSLVLKFEDSKLLALTLSVLCGGAAAGAIMGRQNYLLVLPCLVLLLHAPGGMINRRELIYLGTIGAVALCMVVPIFVIWGGFIPPITADVGSGFSIWNGVSSVGYGSIIAAILAPELFRILFKSWHYSILLIACTLAVVLPMGISLSMGISPIANGKVQSIIAYSIAYSFPVLLASLSVSFLFCMGAYIWEHRSDRIVRFCTCVFMLGILSNAKITSQFSSRYVTVFVPFLLLAVAPLVRLNWHFPIRLACGACISIASLQSYYVLF